MDYRIRARPAALDNPSPRSLSAFCRDSSLLFMPFRLTGDRMQGPLGDDLAPLLEQAPMTGLVLAVTEMDLSAQPDEGKAAEIAEALDALQQAEERLRAAEKSHQNASKDARRQTMAAEEGDHPPSTEPEAERQRQKIEKELETSFRRLAKEQAKVEACLRKLEELGVSGGESERERKDSQVVIKRSSQPCSTMLWQ